MFLVHVLMLHFDWSPYMHLIVAVLLMQASCVAGPGPGLIHALAGMANEFLISVV